MPTRTEILSNFIWKMPDEYFIPLNEIDRLIDGCASIQKSFAHNLISTINVASIPCTLSVASTAQRRFSHLLSAEKIRLLPLSGEESPPDADQLAYQRATEKFVLQKNDPEILKTDVGNALSFLMSAYSDEQFRKAAADLLRQSLVSLWGSLEILATDLSIYTINTRPKFASRLGQTKRVRVPSVSIEDLSKYDFDVSNRLGSIIFHNIRLDNLSSIQDVVSALLMDHDLDKLLKSDGLWQMNQRRNLIVHRRGIVDKYYLDHTDDKLEIGAHIEIDRFALEKNFYIVRDIGLKMISTAARVIAEDQI